MFDLEERIEACQAQLEYKEEKISEIAEGGTSMVKIDSTQSLPEARTLLKMLFGMAVDVKKQEQLKEQEIAKMQVEVSEMARLLEQERDRSRQLKENYEESLSKVMSSEPSEAAPVQIGTPLNERARILLSVSEERNASLRQKCDELESIRDHIDRERQLLHQKLTQEQRELAATREQVKWLESQLSKLTGRQQSAPPTNVSSTPAAISSTSQGSSSVILSATAPKASGPVSWANEFDDDDDEDDEEMTEHHESHAYQHDGISPRGRGRVR
ncbi:hypothetical protein PINS_up016219 [Pythium insidiosum]|nr:hypothetical protein PINS_up016219 [Pythium insidiosum]